MKQLYGVYQQKIGILFELDFLEVWGGKPGSRTQIHEYDKVEITFVQVLSVSVIISQI